MPPEQLVKQFLARLTEARLYREQGLMDGTDEIVKGILCEIETEELPAAAKEEIRSYAESLLDGPGAQSEKGPCSLNFSRETDPVQLYDYGLALMDGQFWEEAIKELSRAADLGVEPLQCRELCGDCAVKLQNWREALRFYQAVYSDESLAQEHKKTLLDKIQRCSNGHPSSLPASSVSENTGAGLPPQEHSPESARDASSAGQNLSLEEVKQTDPHQLYSYGLALLDGQFWEEAIKELSRAANLGVEPLQCRELCGDCAVKLQNWQEAFRFYQAVYSDESLAQEHKKTLLAKISKCSQAQKKEHARLAASVKTDGEHDEKSEVHNPSVLSLSSCLADSAIGQTATSWTDRKGASLSGRIHTYKVIDLLHIGSSSLIVELQDQIDGGRFAGQAITGRFKHAIPAERLATWTKNLMSISSRHLVRIYDLAHVEENFFVVREHLPLSLCDLLSEKAAMPVNLAVNLGYQVLEALGDLHLHMSPDGEIRSTFHLDLRPSRILLEKERPRLKLYNGGFWKEIERAHPTRSPLRDLPLPHLSYKAPEQFRVYLARKRPPIFTDIYLFGTLLYEMLTGVPAFKASSFEEYEIQHCEQYPTPPRVWRSEIPEELNELIMNCLACDPTRRFRSTTQISLALEKSFPSALSRSGDALYSKYITTLRPHGSGTWGETAGAC